MNRRNFLLDSGKVGFGLFYAGVQWVSEVNDLQNLDLCEQYLKTIDAKKQSFVASGTKELLYQNVHFLSCRSVGYSFNSEDIYYCSESQIYLFPLHLRNKECGLEDTIILTYRQTDSGIVALPPISKYYMQVSLRILKSGIMINFPPHNNKLSLIPVSMKVNHNYDGVTYHTCSEKYKILMKVLKNKDNIIVHYELFHDEHILLKESFGEETLNLSSEIV
jgi:hypothetical protein